LVPSRERWPTGAGLDGDAAEIAVQLRLGTSSLAIA
jgi:hypothetical protein